MRKTLFNIITLLVFFCFFFGLQHQVALGARNTSGPPIFAGQVAVYGSPNSLPPGYEILKVLPHANLTVVRVNPGREKAHAQSLREKGFRAGPNIKLQASATVEDSLYPYQWHLRNIQSEDAWNISTGAGVKIAVLDTGLASGPDGIGCALQGYDVANLDDDPTDGNGHGTHVSGTIAQNTNNMIGTAGMAYDACIMPVKVLDDSGGGSTADIAEGIFWAVDNGAQIINMSLGTNARYKITNDPVMDPALDYAYSNNVTVVCAAGNDGSKRNVSYPAIYSTTIAVGAVGYDNEVTRYSNKGAGLDLVAPGGNLSEDLNRDGYGDGVLQETFDSDGWGYFFYQGTSMASPHVAAVAAMLISNETATVPDAIREALTFSAEDLGATGYDTVSGYGLVQAYNSLLYGVDYSIDQCSEPDLDLDGFDAIECGGTDCNDNNYSINPDAGEICGDGIDQNCSGEADEGCQTICLPKGEPCSSGRQCCSGRCSRAIGCR